jgi:hypothetical protein
LRNHIAHIWGEFAEEDKYRVHIDIIKSTIRLINSKTKSFVVEELKKSFDNLFLKEDDYDKFISFGFNDIVDGVGEILKLS